MNDRKEVRQNLHPDLSPREALIGMRGTFVTTGGLFTGTIADIMDDGFDFELRDVLFRPAGAFNVILEMKTCWIYGSHIVASIPELDAGGPQGFLGAKP